MSSDTAWSFSMASAFDDNDSTEEEESQAKSPTQLQEHQIRDLDISSREDTVNYRPNPFSIAKINAASRSKDPISLVRNAAGQSGNDISTSMPSRKPLETRRQTDIRTAFRKQGQKSCHVAGTRSNQSATFSSEISLNSVSAADATSDLGDTTDSDLIGDCAERVIPFKRTPFAEQRSPVTEPRATMSSIPHILDPAKPGQHAGEITQMGAPSPNFYGVDTPAILRPRSPPFHGTPKRLSLRPSFITHKTENYERRHRSSPPISGRFAGSTTLKSLAPGSQHVELSTHSRTNRGLFAKLHDTAFPATHNLSRSPFSAPLGAKPASPPAPVSDEYDFASDDTLVASPIQRPTALHLYGATEARDMSSAHRTVNQTLHDPDEEWSTIPQRKKAKTSAQGMKRDRRTGYFSVNPGLIHVAKKVGVSANSSQRIIKFLPPPLRSVPEHTCSRVNDDRSDHAQITFIQGMNVSTKPSSRLMDHLTDNSERFVQVDTDGIARRYRQSQALRQKRRWNFEALSDLLGLPSCGCIYQDPNDQLNGGQRILVWNARSSTFTASIDQTL